MRVWLHRCAACTALRVVGRLAVARQHAPPSFSVCSRSIVVNCWQINGLRTIGQPIRRRRHDARANEGFVSCACALTGSLTFDLRRRRVSTNWLPLCQPCRHWAPHITATRLLRRSSSADCRTTRPTTLYAATLSHSATSLKQWLSQTDRRARAEDMAL